MEWKEILINSFAFAVVLSLFFCLIILSFALLYKKRVFLICPVRNISDEEKTAIASYISRLEKFRYRVYWPLRDTDQNDGVGLRICTDNCKAINNADEIHIWYNKNSIGSIFDFGAAFALHKPIIVANPEAITPTPHKSFENVLLELHAKNLKK